MSTTVTVPVANSQDTTDNNLGDEEGEDVPPPEPKIEKYEEPNAKHSIRCKLYERIKGSGSNQADDNKLNLTGIGTLFVKSADTPDKLHLVLRQDPDMLKVIFNEYITSSIPIKLLGKAIQMIMPIPSGGSKLTIFKFKDDSDASTVFDILKSLGGK